jgi:hypothetical protein
MDACVTERQNHGAMIAKTEKSRPRWRLQRFGIDLANELFQIHGVSDHCKMVLHKHNCAGTRRQSSSPISHLLDSVAVDTKTTGNFT